MEKIIVIVGGSFNPPTKAHLEMAKICKDRVKADLVIFVPTKADYMKEWKKYQNTQIIDENKRVAALKSLEEDWLRVDTCEIDGLVSGSSYETIQYIKDKYETKSVYFGIGSDKLQEIPRWKNSEKLLSEERFLLLARDHENIDSAIESNEELYMHRNAFIKCNNSESSYGISSTLAREYLRNGSLHKLRGIVPYSVFVILTNDTTNGDIK